VQTHLLRASALEPGLYNDAGVGYRGAAGPGLGLGVGGPVGGQAAARMWPRNSGYAPFSSSAALEAARRRTQDLYNARRSQLGVDGASRGAPSPPLPPLPPVSTEAAFLPPPSPSPSPPGGAAGRHMLWSGTSGRPHAGSYVIGARQLDEGDRSSSVAAAASVVGSAAYQQLQQSHSGAESSSMYTPRETATTHTIVVEAAVEPHQPNSPDAPAGLSPSSPKSGTIFFHFHLFENQSTRDH